MQIEESLLVVEELCSGGEGVPVALLVELFAEFRYHPSFIY